MILLALILQAVPLPDCGDGSDLEIAECYSAAYARADAELNQLWPGVLAAARKADQGFTPTPRRDKASAVKDLLAAQRAWVGFRDAQCAAEADYAQGGSLENIIVGRCLTDMTRERIAKLEDIQSGYEEK